jgi:hypothetical protein
MTFSGFLFGCALLIIVGGKVLLSYISSDPCEGSGNRRSSLHYDYDDNEDDESTETDVTQEIAKLSKKIDDLKRRK